MWVKGRSERGRLRFLKLDDMNELTADRLPIPHTVKDPETQEWYTDQWETYGIFFNIPDGYMCLQEFDTLKEAEESLVNLMLAWQRCKRDFIYLVPDGTQWIIDPILMKEKPRE